MKSFGTDSLDKRAFSYVAPAAWNILPSTLHNLLMRQSFTGS